MARSTLALILTAVCAAACCGIAAAADVERLVLIDGKSAAGWQCDESTLTPAEVDGAKALLFRVQVDWEGGEPGYPIGWPRIHFGVPAGQGDWRTWEQVRLRVYAKKVGAPFPAQPLGITISSGRQNVSWEKNCSNLQAGAWQEFVFDLRDAPARDNITSLGVFISESEYSDGDVLEFYISDLELLRYTRPTLMTFQPLGDVAFADAKALSAIVDILGVAAGTTASVEIELRKGGEAIATAVAQAAEGQTQVSLPLSKPLPPGAYSLAATAGGRALSHNIMLVASPWQEVKP
ncbi:MAG: hypothetical protein ABSD48_08150 [Armatimonadota bacterium]|jgi:hypothetical protein